MALPYGLLGQSADLQGDLPDPRALGSGLEMGLPDVPEYAQVNPVLEPQAGPVPSALFSLLANQRPLDLRYQHGGGAAAAAILHALTRGVGLIGATKASRVEQANAAARATAAEQNKTNAAATAEARKARLEALKERNKVSDDEASRFTRMGPEAQKRYLDAKTRITEATTRPEKVSDNEPLVLIDTPNGPRYVKRSDALGKPPPKAEPKPQPVRGADRQALAFYNRAKDAVQTIDSPYENGQSLEQIVSGSDILGQAQLQGAPNFLQTKAQRAYRQSQRAFTEARLRKESGAAIPPAEFESDAKTYFAQPGDSPETIDQKRLARQVVLDGLGYASGPAYEEYYNEPFKPTQHTTPTPPKPISKRRPLIKLVREKD